jgi:NADPH2:quinone reductase
VDDPPGGVVLQVTAAGVNWADTHQAENSYLAPAELPLVPGGEVVGTTPDGRRVVALVGSGGYAERAVASPAAMWDVPDGVDDGQALGLVLQGTTAWHLLRTSAQLRAGETVLVHAAAGGVGSILVPWLKHVGATVIAHSGDSRKAAIATTLGADHSLCCPMEELAGEVRGLTQGKGVPVVLDGVGAASWKASLGSVGRRGLIATYGNASGPVPPFTALDLLTAGSIFVTRPTLADYATTTEEMRTAAARVFELIANGTIEVAIGGRFPLLEAAEAHRALEARKTTGSTILVP